MGIFSPRATSSLAGAIGRVSAIFICRTACGTASGFFPKRPIYGAFFWINGDGRVPVPKEAYYMSGAGGQWTLIIPSHDLVVVRLATIGAPRPANGASAQRSCC